MALFAGLEGEAGCGIRGVRSTGFCFIMRRRKEDPDDDLPRRRGTTGRLPRL